MHACGSLPRSPPSSVHCVAKSTKKVLKNWKQRCLLGKKAARSTSMDAPLLESPWSSAGTLENLARPSNPSMRRAATEAAGGG